jgi:hypothetical protein
MHAGTIAAPDGQGLLVLESPRCHGAGRWPPRVDVTVQLVFLEQRDDGKGGESNPIDASYTCVP